MWFWRALLALILLSSCSTSSTDSPTVTTVFAESPATSTPAVPTTAPAVTQTTLPADRTTTATETTTTTSGAILVSIEGGEIQTQLRQEVALGSEVTIEVTSDIADQVHLHTYDVVVEVAPGAPGVLEFTATIPGIFELELEAAHLQILELVVQ